MTELFCCEAEQLAQNLLAFVVDRAKRLEDHGAEEVVSAFELLVVLAVLLGPGVLVRWVLQAYAGRDKRAGHSKVDGEAVSFRPAGDGNVSRPTAGSGAKDALLLKDGVLLAVGGDGPGSSLEEKKRDKSEREMSAVREEVGGRKRAR